jgi:hypothetical protein
MSAILAVAIYVVCTLALGVAMATTPGWDKEDEE